jgi:hypothetical protein
MAKLLQALGYKVAATGFAIGARDANERHLLARLLVDSSSNKALNLSQILQPDNGHSEVRRVQLQRLFGIDNYRRGSIFLRLLYIAALPLWLP